MDTKRWDLIFFKTIRQWYPYIFTYVSVHLAIPYEVYQTGLEQTRRIFLFPKVKRSTELPFVTTWRLWQSNPEMLCLAQTEAGGSESELEQACMLTFKTQLGPQKEGWKHHIMPFIQDLPPVLSRITALPSGPALHFCCFLVVRLDSTLHFFPLHPLKSTHSPPLHIW